MAFFIVSKNVLCFNPKKRFFAFFLTLHVFVNFLVAQNVLLAQKLANANSSIKFLHFYNKNIQFSKILLH